MTKTHDVLNQAPPRTDLNEFTTNPALVEATGAFGADWAIGKLEQVGALVGSADFQRDAELANTHLPTLQTHDRWGNRIDQVELDPAYHRVIGAAIASGAHASCWSDTRSGSHVARAATFMLFAQIEPGHACPVSMTHSVVPSLECSPRLAEQWLPKVYSREYDPELRDPATKSAVMFGMALTEKQGGSDVRANTSTAAPATDGSWHLTGHKWFCSAPQSDAFLVLANAPGGLSCFLVPRVLEGGERNAIQIQRLKDKLGNKSNASSEIEFEHAAGWLVGEEGHGVRAIIGMITQTRLDCILGSAAGMRQAVAEAAWHVRHRAAFGKQLIDQPAMRSVIADLQLEAEATTWTGLRVAAAFDDENSTELARMITPVAKYWICKRGPNHAYEALECLGGNGYTEQFPTARRYREQPVMAIWEGSGNVIALDVLRAIDRDPDSLEAFVNEVEAARGHAPNLDRQLTTMHELIDAVRRSPADGPPLARRLVESMALALQAATLVRFAPQAVADAFISARLSPDRSFEYGALDRSLPLDDVIDRACAA